MSAIISLSVTGPPASGGDDLVAEVARHLATTARRGEDGTWELAFEGSYDAAFRHVSATLTELRGDWTAVITLEYALTA